MTTEYKYKIRYETEPLIHREKMNQASYKENKTAKSLVHQWLTCEYTARVSGMRSAETSSASLLVQTPTLRPRDAVSRRVLSVEPGMKRWNSQGCRLYFFFCSFFSSLDVSGKMSFKPFSHAHNHAPDLIVPPATLKAWSQNYYREWQRIKIDKTCGGDIA